MSTDIGDLAERRSEELDRLVVELRRALLADGVRSDDIPDPVVEAMVLVIARLEARHAAELEALRDRVGAIEEGLRDVEWVDDEDDPPGEVHGRAGTVTIGDGTPIPITEWTGTITGILDPEDPRPKAFPSDPTDRGPFGYR